MCLQKDGATYFILKIKRIRMLHKDNSLNILKKGVWLFFFLLIFEGALRKWFVPFLATPLLVVRDPIALWILFEVWRRKLLKFNPYIFAVFIVTAISFILTLIVGHGNLYVAIFGARIYFIYFPLIFAIGKIFDKEDVIKMGRTLLIISIPMLILIMLQFYSPQSAWVNRGVGGDMEGAGFGGAMGYFRPPGTFSFTAGNSMFWGLVAAFVIYFWVVPNQINKKLLITSSICLLMASMFSISRSVLFQIALSIVFALFFFMKKPENMKRIISILIPLLLIFAVVSLLPQFQLARDVMSARFENANEAEGGLAEGVIGNRFFGGFIREIQSSVNMPFWGFGLGMGTNAGSAMMVGERVFLISEGEWGRVFGEMGFLFGSIIIILRALLVVQLFIKSFKQWQKNPLPYMLLSFGALAIISGQWGMPTSLGFAVLTGGLIMASLNDKRYEKNNTFTPYRQPER